MDKQTIYTCPSEVHRAIEEGYPLKFVFSEGFLCCNDYAEVRYCIKDVQKKPIPDLINEMTVYRIETADGLRGYAIAVWDTLREYEF